MYKQLKSSAPIICVNIILHLRPGSNIQTISAIQHKLLSCTKGAGSCLHVFLCSIRTRQYESGKIKININIASYT